MTACVLDSDVVIAGLDRRDAHHDDAVALVKSLTSAEVDLLMSAVNHAEVLAGPAADPDAMRTAIDAMSALGIRTVPATEAIARDAARFRAQRVSLPDGFALATAVAKSASLASFDRRLGRAMETAGVPAATSQG